MSDAIREFAKLDFYEIVTENMTPREIKAMSLEWVAFLQESPWETEWRLWAEIQDAKLALKRKAN